MKSRRFKLGPYNTIGVGGTKESVRRSNPSTGRFKLAPYSFIDLYYTPIYEESESAINKVFKIPYFFSF